jgi:DNA-binding MarR family transcriptional regulator
MSRAHLSEFLPHRTKDMTPEREEIVSAVIDQSRRMSTRTVVFHAAIAERLGLNPSDHKCADLICNETGPITAGRLAELTGLSTGAITGVVDRLERAGFVSRVPDPEDRRRVVIAGCTERRAADMRHLFIPMMEGTLDLCEHYSDAELELIVGFMRRSGEMTDARIQALRAASELGMPVESVAGTPPVSVRTAENPEKTPNKAAPHGANATATRKP